MGVHPQNHGLEVYPYKREGNNGLEVHCNRHTNIRYTLDSKLTNFWYIKESTEMWYIEKTANMGYINLPTKSGYIILDTDLRYIHTKNKETTD